VGRVRDLQRFPRTAEVNLVATDDVPHAYRVDADLTSRSFTRLTLAAEHGVGISRATGGLEPFVQQGECRAARCIDLVAVMGFDDLGIVVVAEFPRDPTDEVQQKVDADAEVCGFDDRDSRNGRLDFGELIGAVPRGAGDQGDAALETLAQPRNRPVGYCKIYEYVTGFV